MKITVLSDNNDKKGFQSEHGLSFYIEKIDKNILFDTGASNIFLRNDEILGVNIKDVDTVVLSHGHFDHGYGLNYIKDKTLICHPGCFKVRHRKNGFANIGLNLTNSRTAGLNSTPLASGGSIFTFILFPTLTI